MPVKEFPNHAKTRLFALPVLLFIITDICSAQSILTGVIINTNISTPSSLNVDLAKEGQKDVSDFFRRKINADSLAVNALKDKNRLGPFVSVVPAVGYAMESGLTGVLSSNISFYTGRKKSKISYVLANIDYSQYHQFWLCVNPNIYAEKQKLIFIGDYRFYKFPTKTYGLGTSSNMEDAVSIDYNYLKISQVVLREITGNIFAGIGYHQDYHFNIREILNYPT